MRKKYSKSDLMKVAIEEHLKCTEFPRVGVVISKGGIIISTGHRGERKGIHAERVAIEKVEAEKLGGSELFTTLEPCVSIKHDQTVESCSELIIKSGITEVIIGVLDPNGTIYSKGYRKLLESNLNVSFFNRKLRAAVEEETFDFGIVNKIIGPGKRRIPVVNSGTSIDVQFSEKDTRTIKIRWSTLQIRAGCVDLIGPNGSIKVASGVTKFTDITDPTVFRFPSHFARMKKGMIAVVNPIGGTFCLLIQLIAMYNNDILVQWEMRNID